MSSSNFLMMKFRQMLPKASTIFVHIALVVSVSVYTLFGALIIQHLESPERIRSQMKRELWEPPKAEKSLRVYLGPEIAALDPQVHNCLIATLGAIFADSKCSQYTLDKLNIASIDRCYENANIASPVIGPVLEPKGKAPEEDDVEVEPIEKWSFGNALIFAFTVITTIGYGHVAPETFEGRLFCIIYGVIGVPFTLLTIADLGMFLTKILRTFLLFCKKMVRRATNGKSPRPLKSPEKNSSEMKTAREPGEEDEEEGPPEDEEVETRKTDESILLGVTFTCYLVAGAKILSVYEPEMDFFKAIYFNFVTLTTIGLGDFVPKSFDYLFVTLVYIGIGLALTTMAIEIAADLLRKIHYAGRKMENVANTAVWFGGKKMSMKNLVKYLGDQFNIPESELANFELDKFVDNAMKVEKGEIKTLRKEPSPAPVVFREKRAFSYSNVRKSNESKNLHYMDDRMSKLTTDLTTVHETTRTVDTLQALANDSDMVPRLDLDYQFTNMTSAPTSFDEDYLKTFTFVRSGEF